MKYKQSNNTKEKIFKEVFKLMLTQNIEKTTISILEKKLNLTRGAFFYYFSNKDNLIEMTIQYYITKISDIFFSEKTSEHNTLENYIEDRNIRLQNFLDWLKTENSISKPCFSIMNFYIQAKTFLPSFETKMTEFIAREEHHLVGILAESIQNKEIRNCASPAEIAKILINLYISTFFGPGSLSANEDIDAIFISQQTKSIYNILKI